ncbi:MAG TPA: LytTR family transcriptional regulator DNA-binding domain-containing protein [Steroidobacteraceae bacterium]|nr:LytTR family transcriptional regulator DNA-binding domain-containing protein [Steroidobacteraceae bacterium]
MNPTAPAAPRSSRGWRIFELGFWPAMAVVQTFANSLIVLLEDRRRGGDLMPWEPLVWEGSSNGMLLLLVPAVLWFTRRFPLHFDTWKRHLPWHLLGSVAFSLAHVLGMVAVRKFAYATQGADYAFGDWPSELLYEYLKDVRTYALFVAVIEGYRFLRRRLQGEARILDAPDEGPPLESVERPERFLVRKLGREFLVAAADIEWLQASGNYVNLRMRGHDYPLRSTLAALETKLDPARFARIHRSYMVNLDQVASIEPLETADARVHLKDKTVLPCSRRYRDALRGHLSRLSGRGRPEAG